MVGRGLRQSDMCVCVLRERMAGRGLYIDKLLMGNICNGCCKANFIAAVSLVMIGVRSD